MLYLQTPPNSAFVDVPHLLLPTAIAAECLLGWVVWDCARSPIYRIGRAPSWIVARASVRLRAFVSSWKFGDVRVLPDKNGVVVGCQLIDHPHALHGRSGKQASLDASERLT